jgi:uncharacterized protein YjiS (DUF1127 family)
LDLNEQRIPQVSPRNKTMSPILKTIRRWRDKTFYQGRLARLDAHMLRDIGISRFDVDCVIGHPR